MTDTKKALEDYKLCKETLHKQEGEKLESRRPYLTNLLDILAKEAEDHPENQNMKNDAFCFKEVLNSINKDNLIAGSIAIYLENSIANMYNDPKSPCYFSFLIFKIVHDFTESLSYPSGKELCAENFRESIKVAGIENQFELP
jgi:hypothetical protein